jgi:ADP-heptose:LPS heptosyltransferase
MNRSGIRRLLVVNLGGAGDILLSSPALRGLRALYRDAVISALVSARSHDIMRSFPYVDKVHPLDIGYGGRIALLRLPAALSLILSLRRERFDLAVNMRPLHSRASAGKIKLLMDMIRPGGTAGRDTDGRGYFFDVRTPETDIARKYDPEYDMDTVRLLGGEVSDRRVELNIDKESDSRAESILRDAGALDGTIVGIHPGGMPSRRWPEESFAEAMMRIGSELGCRFVITGGREERDLAKRLSSVGNAVDLSGRLGIMETGAVIKRCALYISNDTGPMHMAAALGTPLVAIFGPGDVTRFDPRNISDKVRVLYKRRECAPCTRVRCWDMSCLDSITPGEVTKAALELMKGV